MTKLLRAYRILRGFAVSLTAAALLPACAQQRVAVSDLGLAPASQPVQASLYLKPSAVHAADLQQFLQNVQTPGTSEYGHFVSPAEFAQRFGADATQQTAVAESARALGLDVLSTDGLRVRVSGMRSSVDAAFAVQLHKYTTPAGKLYVGSATSEVIPSQLASTVLNVGGLNTVPEAAPFTLAADGQPVTTGGYGSLDDLATAVASNTARVLTLHSAETASSWTEADQETLRLVLAQAAAQGMTILTDAGGTTADAAVPAVFSQAFSTVAVAGTQLGSLASETRPTWQNASGLPADGLRHIPDATVSSLDALSTTFEQILSSMPVNSDGTPARLGNVAPTIYALSTQAGLFTQPDGAAAGTWEPGTGLGTLSLSALAKLYPRGVDATDTSVTLDNPGATHGQNITFSSTVKDISGKGGGAVPTGSVTYTLNTGTTLGPVTLSNGTASITTNKLSASYGYSVTAQYTGDGTYAGSSSTTSFSVAPEPATITATPTGSVKLGGTMSVQVSVTIPSGVGSPAGTATLAPQGTSDTSTYTAALGSTSTSTATATVTAPAVKAGNIVVLAACTPSTSDFTCYTPVQANVTVTQATPTVALTTSVSGANTVFNATVTGLGSTYPVPSGNVVISDNGASLGTATLSTTGATSITLATPSSATHSYVATYQGDSNYVTANSTAQANAASVASTTLLSVSPNPPVSGSTTTLTASVASGSSSSIAVPTGTVTFYEDGVALSPTATLTNGIATYTSSTLSSATAHTFYAVYAGDATYQTSTSASVATAAATTGTTTTTLTVNPNPPVSGSVTTLQATIGYTASGSTTPSGTVTFFQDGTALSPAATVTNGVATYTSTTLSGTAAHSFYAKYSGDTNYSTSTSATVSTASTTGAATTTALTVNPNPPVSGSLTTLQATVGYAASGSTAPTGTVTFYQDGTALSPAATVTNGVATYTSTALSGTAAHTFFAKYSGDTNYTTSTSPSVSTAATTATTTTTTLSINPTKPVAGSTTTLSAKIGYTANGTTTPSGVVTFYQDGVALTPAATVTAGTATYTSTTLSSTAAHSYTATYAGDTNFSASTSAAVTTSAASGTTTSTGLTVSPNPPVSGKITTLTASIAYSGTTAPTGTVTFYQDGVALSPAATVVAGASTASATYTSTLLSSSAAHTFYAVYSGDTTYASSQSTAVATAASSNGTTASVVTLTSSASSVNMGGTVTLRAAVSPAAGGTTVATGSVTFSSATQGVLGTAVLDSTGVASLTVALSTAGTQAITATYGGDSTYAASTSAAVAVTVSGTNANALFALNVSPASVPYGSSVTLTTTLTATPTSGTTGPSGTVTWVLTPNFGGNPVTYVGTLTPTSTTTATASATFQAPAAGNYTVTATCTGTNFSCTGLSATAGLQVTKVVTLTNLGATPSTPVAGVAETLTAYIAFAYTTTNASCTGSVTFYVNSAVAGTVLVSNNQATYSLTLPSTASNKIYAVYSGDQNCAASTSTVATLSIPPAATVSSLNANYTTALQGANEVFTVVVNSVASTSNSNPGVPAGTVTFYDTFNGVQTQIGSAALTQTGTSSAAAVIQTTGLRTGVHTISASYLGASLYAASDATALGVTIQDFTVALSPAVASTTKGQTVTALATIAAQYGFSGSVVLNCTPPSGSATTCVFSPAVLTGGGGITTLTITTTAAKAGLLERTHGVEWAGIFGLAGLVWAGRRKRRLPALLMLAAGFLLLHTVTGCTTVRSSGYTTGGTSGGTTATGGTPSGTLQFTISASGTDGRTTNLHTSSYQVTVQ